MAAQGKDPRAVAIGGRVRQARKASRCSQSEIARAAGLDPATIYKIENGLSYAHEGTLSKLAVALQVDAEWLSSGKGKGPKSFMPPTATGALPDQVPRVLLDYLNGMATERPELFPIKPEEMQALLKLHRDGEAPTQPRFTLALTGIRLKRDMSDVALAAYEASLSRVRMDENIDVDMTH